MPVIADRRPTGRPGSRRGGGAGGAALETLPGGAAARRGDDGGGGGAQPWVQRGQRLRLDGRWRRQDGVAGLRRRRSRRRHRSSWTRPGRRVLVALLATDPQAHGHQATGWTVPLLRAELANAGYAVGERTVRRALHRLGYRWKRPHYVLGRPDPAYAEKRGP